MTATSSSRERGEVIMTLEGVKMLEEELAFLKSVKRQEVSERIGQARSFGDISENAEYDEAKNEQARVEGRILDLENMLRGVKVVDEDELTTDIVAVGVNVVVKDEGGNTVTYAIVGSAEADPMRMRISNESPVGRALLGHKLGDVVSVLVPAGEISLTIESIER